MFQNIQPEVGQEEEKQNKKKQIHIKEIIKSNFTIQNIMLSTIAFAISSMGCGTSMAPFALAMFAAVCSNEIPAGVIFLMTLLGTLVGLGKEEALIYLLTAFVFLVGILLFKPKWNEEYRNEKRRLGKYVLGSVLLVQLGRCFLGTFLVYDFLASIALAVTTYIFYKIFSNSIITISQFQIKKAFSIEEVVGSSLLLCIAIAALRGFSIFGFEIKTICSILIVLILGWKNGILLGATSGITIGTVLGIVGIGDITLIATFALSGMLAGILSRFGKFGVAIGFILGNAVLTYAANGNTLPVIYFKEILVASIALILVPNKIEIRIEDLIPQTKLLPNGSNYRLEENKDTIYKLNTMSQTILDMANSYKEVAATTVEQEDLEERNKEIFTEEFKKNIENYPNNILYEDLAQQDSIFVKDIFESLNQVGDMTRKELIDIFAYHNNYLVGFDNVTASMQVEEDIAEIVKVINDSFRISKVNFVWQQKMNENKKNLSTQLDGVSKVIQSMAEEMESDTSLNQFQQKEQEIKIICEQKGILIQDITIKQEDTGKYLIHVYLNKCLEEQVKECPIEKIEKILTKVLQEKIVLQKEKCAIKKATNICKQIYVSANPYQLQIGMAIATKNKQTVSGDSYLVTKLEDGKQLMAISDGMGSRSKC